MTTKALSTLALILLALMCLSCSTDGAKEQTSIGDDYYGRGEFDQAIASYSKAIELDPKYENAYNNRGLAYDDQGKFDQAIADYSMAIELDPKYIDAYYNRGIAYCYGLN